MKSLVIVAHGSHRKLSNDEVIGLTKRLQQCLQHQFPIVQAGFLEFAAPSISDAINACLDQGATEVVVLPYFLSAGKHVYEDIPNEIDKVRRQINGVSIEILDHIGSTQGMTVLIRDMVLRSM